MKKKLTYLILGIAIISLTIGLMEYSTLQTESKPQPATQKTIDIKFGQSTDLTQGTTLSPLETNQLEIYMDTEKYLNDNGIQMWVSGKYTVCPASENKTCQAWYDEHKIETPINAKLWWTDVNGTHFCRVYRDIMPNDIGHGYTGIGCSDAQMEKFYKAQNEMDKQIERQNSNPIQDQNTRILEKLNQTNNLLAMNFCKHIFDPLPQEYYHLDLKSCVNKVLEDTN